ncbi:MAG: L-seryl-tRNA selenium transferase [Chloroflexota bacterium]
MNQPVPNVYERLGVRTVINAIGTYTRLSGTLMPEPVVEAMVEASRHFVCIEELQYQVGQKIAQMTGAQAAYVTSGAQAGLVLSIAACITGLDPEKMDRMPHTDGIPNEVIMAKAHRNHYDHAVETAGGHIVEVGTGATCHPQEVEEAITDRTTAVLYLPWDAQSLAETVAIANKHSLPVVVDGAAQLQDPKNLRAFIAQGAALVTYSGGKFIQGPQASGFVCGRKDLIAAIAWQHLDMDAVQEVWTAPRELLGVEKMPFMPRQGIGRGYKAGKEEIVGLITALELYLERDHDAEYARCEAQAKTIVTSLQGIDGVMAEIVPPEETQSRFHFARIRVDQKILGMSGYDFILALKNGEPSIHPLERELDDGAVVVHPFGLQPGDDELVVARVREIVAG